jgi:uncharacterized membrane protein
MCLRWVLGVAAFAVASGAAYTPANAEFRVCNKSGERVDVAFGYDGGRAGWIAEGWWTLGTGRCVIVHAQNLNNRYYYLYAEGNRGTEWNGENDRTGSDFCITRKAFKLFQRRYGQNHEADCSKHGLESKTFFEVNVGNYLRWTQTLDPGTDEPALHPTPDVPKSGPPPGKAPPPSKPPPRGSACERFPNLC